MSATIQLGEQILKQVNVIGSNSVLKPGEKFRVKVIPPPFIQIPSTQQLLHAADQPGLSLDLGKLKGDFAVSSGVDVSVQALMNAIGNNLSTEVLSDPGALGLLDGYLKQLIPEIKFNVQYRVTYANGDPVPASNYRTIPPKIDSNTIASDIVPLEVEFLFRPHLIDELDAPPNRSGAKKPFNIDYYITINFILSIGGVPIESENNSNNPNLTRIFHIQVEPIRVPALLLLGSHKNFEPSGSPVISTEKGKVAGVIVVLVRYGSILSADSSESLLNNIFSKFNDVTQLLSTLNDLFVLDPLSDPPLELQCPLPNGAVILVPALKWIEGLEQAILLMRKVPIVFAHSGNVEDFVIFVRGTWLGFLLGFIEDSIQLVIWHFRFIDSSMRLTWKLITWLGRAVKKAVQLRKLPPFPDLDLPPLPPIPVWRGPDSFRNDASSLFLFGIPGTQATLYLRPGFKNALQTFDVPDGTSFKFVSEFGKSLNDLSQSVLFGRRKLAEMRR
ncbi:MAG TPA: hypothetical protein VGQ13_01295 [Nitrososphaera sp.]|jgi:hypothetical protein|nr:hypothetical protein [Nitrososphaera sp.]